MPTVSFNDVEAAIAFYAEHLGFEVDVHRRR